MMQAKRINIDAKLEPDCKDSRATQSVDNTFAEQMLEHILADEKNALGVKLCQIEQEIQTYQNIIYLGKK